jgi:hypothetical protein
MRKQTAVWWAVASIDSHGKEVYASPVQIKCRWEDVSVQFLDAQGEIQMSNAVVYTDRITPTKGVLMEGKLADITDPVNIKENEGAWEIRRFDKLPTLNNKEVLMTAHL